MKLLDRMRRLFRGGKVVAQTQQFDHGVWSRSILDQFKDSMLMAGLFDKKHEPNDPMTKALIVQSLNDIMVKHPNLTMREIINACFADGIKDDYEFLEKLTKIEAEGILRNMTATEITIRTKYSQRRMDNDIQDAMSYAMKGLVDNAAMLAKTKPVQSAGCVDPADKTGSGAG